MLFNYLKSAFRNVQKSRLFSLIHILGLSVGMAVCLLIMHYVKFEQSYDKFHDNYERIYRLRYERTSSEGKTVRFASCTPPAAPLIRQRFPQVEKIAKLLNYPMSVSHEDLEFSEDRLFFMEPEFFEIFNFTFIEGDPIIGLQDPNKAYISQSTAQKYFGDENPIGKYLSLDKQEDYQIIGLFQDVPANSHIKFDIVLPYKNIIKMLGPEYNEAWGHTGAYTYLRLEEGTTPADLKDKFAELVTTSCPWLKEYKMTIDLVFQPLTDIHLTSHFMQEYEVNGNKDTVRFLFIIALFIIVIAWVNYINLSTAQSLSRAREVGLRKVVGASKAQLAFQFYLETILLNGIAVLFALLFVRFFYPVFSHITGTPLDWSIWSQPWFWRVILLLFAAGILFSGIYPVLTISSFEPIKVLKGKVGQSVRGFSLRKALVVFQFVMALLLITGTMAVYQQINYMRKQKLGFNMNQIVVIKAPRVRDESFKEKLQVFRDELLRQSDVNKFCAVTEVPGRQIYWDAGGIQKYGEDDSHGKNYQIVGVDYDFIDLFDLQLVSGRNFSREFSTDDKALILNETAVKWMGFETSKSAVGQRVSYWGETYNIIGVLKDFHQQSPKEAFEPHIYRFMPHGRGNRGQFAVNINTLNVSETIDILKEKYDLFFPGNPFDYFFLDDYYNQQYKADELLGKVIGLFSFLAIFVTGLGILGLASFMATQRIKEIGIRKVLGASVPGILGLLLMEFIQLITISFVIALPLSFWGIHRWLSTFANQMNLNVWLFSLPLILIGLVTFLTVSSQSVNAAIRNPVETLRYE